VFSGYPYTYYTQNGCVTDKTRIKATIDSQAYAVVRFCWNYAIPICVFPYCYGRIFHTIRRQSKVLSGHAEPHQAATPSTSRDQNTGQIQQQATGTKFSHTEMNVLKTLISIIVCYIIFWSVPDISEFLRLLGVS